MIRGSMHAICSQNINKTKKFNYTAANEPSSGGKVCGFIFLLSEENYSTSRNSEEKIRQMIMGVWEESEKSFW
jgi:hypothetical protein